MGPDLPIRQKMRGWLMLLAIVCGLGCERDPAGRVESELRWGEFGYYSKWDRHPYEIESQYDFIGRLPDLTEFPRLLEIAGRPGLSQTDRTVIVSQLRTLSRCDFETMLDADSDAEAVYQSGISKWAEWWSGYGRRLAEELPKTGQRSEAAWKLVAPTPYLECPKYPIVIPESWSATLTFASGDYGGSTEEIIEFRVGKDACELSRKYRTGWAGKGEWIREVWKDFRRDEADLFFFALVYAIDHPWFFGDDALAETEEREGSAKTGGIRGRQPAWTIFFRMCRGQGFWDRRGR